MDISITFTDETSLLLDLDSGENLALVLARVYAQIAGHRVDQIAQVYVQDGARSVAVRLRPPTRAGAPAARDRA